MAFKTINVTAEDIANGKKGDNKLCPIGLASARVLGGKGLDDKSVSVTEKTIDLISRWAWAFDHDQVFRATPDDPGTSATPFSFQVEVPDA